MLPQLENAILSGHDIIFLGERGQAKTPHHARRWSACSTTQVPVIAGLRDQRRPVRPDLQARPRTWSRSDGDEADDRVDRRATRRYGEKLATPDITIADLIGEVDPIKVAEGRYLSDELTMHYGLLPRTNRGIFCINELPDLAERIQVGLLNVMEEHDVQIRGYRVRLPLDLFVVASANPEDYTKRGRIITPLKDRFGSQIRTHYPRDDRERSRSWRQETHPFRRGLRADRPDFMKEMVAELTHLARRSPTSSSVGRLGAHVDRELREPREQLCPSRGAARRITCGAANHRPRFPCIIYCGSRRDRGA